MDANPYESPGTTAQATRRGTSGGFRWRLIPTVFLGIVGALILLFGIVTFGGNVWFRVFVAEAGLLSSIVLDFVEAIAEILAGFGLCVASRAFWRCRWRLAILAVIVSGIFAIGAGFNIYSHLVP